MVGLLFFIGGLFQRPLKWHQGHMPPCPPSYATEELYEDQVIFCWLQKPHGIKDPYLKKCLPAQQKSIIFPAKNIKK